ncbi:MAG: hypothetical protein WHT07_00065 [Desulfobaccales bacterium]
MTTWLSSRGLKLILGAFVVAYALNSLAATVADPDLWGFLAFGRLFWNSPSFPYEDVFSFTPTLKPWVYHEWLSGVIFYPIYQAFGAAGLHILKYAVGLTTIWFLYRTAVLRGAHPLAVVVLFLPILPLFRAFYNPVRPQVFTFLFVAIFLYLLERARLLGQYWPLVWVPVIMVPWANLHGGFVAGLGLLLLYAVGEALSRRVFWPYVLALGAGILATLINPYGLQYWHYMADALAMPRPMITEWMSMFHYANYVKKETSLWHAVSFPILFFALMAFSGFLMWRSRWREFTPSIVLAVGLILAVKHVRHFILFYCFILAYLPICFKPYVEDLSSRPGLQDLWRKTLVRQGCFALILVVTVTLATTFIRQGPWALTFPSYSQKGKTGMYYPLDIFDYLEREQLSGKLLVEFVWGEYVLWRFHPRITVALDGRFETVYPPEVVNDYFAFYSGLPGWERFLEKYRPDFILIKDHGKLVELLQSQGVWQVLRREPGAVLLGPSQINP